MIEVTVEGKLTDTLNPVRYGRAVGRGGYRHDHRPRALTRPTGPLAITLRRAPLLAASDAREWTYNAFWREVTSHESLASSFRPRPGRHAPPFRDLPQRNRKHRSGLRDLRAF